jgi:hypothetical protein
MAAFDENSVRVRTDLDGAAESGRSAFSFGFVFSDVPGQTPGGLTEPLEPGQILINRADQLMFIPLANGQFLTHSLEGSILSKIFVANDGAVSTTTSNNFQNKLSLAETFPAGDYLLLVSYGWNLDSVGVDFEARVMLDGTQMGEPHVQEPKDNAGTFGATGTDQRHYVSRMFNVSLDGAQQIDLDWRSSSAGVEASMWDVVIVAINVTGVNSL